MSILLYILYLYDYCVHIATSNGLWYNKSNNNTKKNGSYREKKKREKATEAKGAVQYNKMQNEQYKFNTGPNKVSLGKKIKEND